MTIFLRRQQGDTIVEVLMALLVLSVSLAAAFAIANRSQNTTQDNHERYQAQLLATEQAERIRQAAYINSTRSQFLTTNNLLFNNLFCMSPSSTPTATTPPNTYCTHNINGGVTYRISIRAVLPSKDVYFIKVEWESLKGSMGKVELAYGI